MRCSTATTTAGATSARLKVHALRPIQVILLVLLVRAAAFAAAAASLILLVAHQLRELDLRGRAARAGAAAIEPARAAAAQAPRLEP